MVLVDGQDLGVRLGSACPGEATLAEATLKEVRVSRAKGRAKLKRISYYHRYGALSRIPLIEASTSFLRLQRKRRSAFAEAYVKH